MDLDEQTVEVWTGFILLVIQYGFNEYGNVPRLKRGQLHD